MARIEIHPSKIVYVTAVTNESYFLNNSISISRSSINDLEDIESVIDRFLYLEIHAYMDHDPRRCRNYSITLEDFHEEINWRGDRYGVIKLEKYRCE